MTRPNYTLKAGESKNTVRRSTEWFKRRARSRNERIKDLPAFVTKSVVDIAPPKKKRIVK